jgi:hypothetical protein
VESYRSGSRRIELVRLHASERECGAPDCTLLAAAFVESATVVFVSAEQSEPGRPSDWMTDSLFAALWNAGVADAGDHRFCAVDGGACADFSDRVRLVSRGHAFSLELRLPEAARCISWRTPREPDAVLQRPERRPAPCASPRAQRGAAVRLSGVIAWPLTGGTRIDDSGLQVQLEPASDR